MQSFAEKMKYSVR